MPSDHISFCDWAIQYHIPFYIQYLLKSDVSGRPIMYCKECAHTALEHSLTVYLDLFLSTVLTKTFPMSFLTSEKNSPFLEGLNTKVVPYALCTRKPWLRVLSYVTLCFFLHIAERQYINNAFLMERYSAVPFQIALLCHNCLLGIT